MKIAIYLQDDNELDSFMQSDKIELYQKEGGWVLCKTIPLSKPFPVEIEELRELIKRCVHQMEDCKIIAGGELTGIPYHIFNQMGFSIFDIQEFSPALFDEILDDIKESGEEQRIRMLRNSAPVETSTPGIYSLDLVTLQTECPAVSSKKALQPFLEKTPFLELKLLCDHIPPWLENGCYNITSEKRTDGKINAVITKKNC